MANTDVVLQGVKDYTLELLGTEFRDSAASSATASASSATRSESAATRSEGAAENAAEDAAATSADRVATGEDRAQTGEDREAAGGWADSSTTSAALSLLAAATQSQMVGDGFPEGKVAAPVGSIYVDRLATSGAVRWVKTAGTGNTGWQVEYGDTGWRRLEHYVDGYRSGIIRIRRTGVMVFWEFQNLIMDEQAPSWNQFNVPLKDGFAPHSHLYFPATPRNSLGSVGPIRIGNNDTVYLYDNRGEDKFYTATLVYPTSNLWPASLIGVPL